MARTLIYRDVRPYVELVVGQRRPETQINQTYISLCTEIVRDIFGLMSNPECEGAIISGNYGSFKTTIAQAIGKIIDGRGNIDVVHTDENDLGLSIMKGGPKMVEWYMSRRVLILDDVGWEEEVINYMGTKISPMRYIIGGRYNMRSWGPGKQITILTTNLSPDEFRDRYGQRIYERVYEDGWLIPYQLTTSQSARVSINQSRE